MAARSSSADRLGSGEVLERAGNVQTRRFELSAPLLPEPRYPFLKKLFADGGYQGPQVHKALAQVLPQASVEIVKRSDTATGFEVAPIASARSIAANASLSAVAMLPPLARDHSGTASADVLSYLHARRSRERT